MSPSSVGSGVFCLSGTLNIVLRIQRSFKPCSTLKCPSNTRNTHQRRGGSSHGPRRPNTAAHAYCDTSARLILATIARTACRRTSLPCPRRVRPRPARQAQCHPQPGLVLSSGAQDACRYESHSPAGRIRPSVTGQAYS